MKERIFSLLNRNGPVFSLEPCRVQKTITQEDVMEEFSGDIDDDDDEIDCYIITKISFSKDDTILEW